jgi:hypothetical protein
VTSGSSRFQAAIMGVSALPGASALTRVPARPYSCAAERVSPITACFIAEIPKTTVGKYDKKLLRTRFKAGELPVRRLKD